MGYYTNKIQLNSMILGMIIPEKEGTFIIRSSLVKDNKLAVYHIFYDNNNVESSMYIGTILESELETTFEKKNKLINTPKE